MMRRLILGLALLSLAIFLPGCAVDEGLEDLDTVVPAAASPTLIFFFTDN